MIQLYRSREIWIYIWIYYKAILNYETPLYVIYPPNIIRNFRLVACIPDTSRIPYCSNEMEQTFFQYSFWVCLMRRCNICMSKVSRETATARTETFSFRSFWELQWSTSEILSFIHNSVNTITYLIQRLYEICCINWFWIMKNNNF